MKPKPRVELREISRRSRFGLYLANFCLAELVGVIIPMLNDLLAARHWSYDDIGIAAAMPGLGLLLGQVPAGLLIDRFRGHRNMLMMAALAVGVCFGVIPLMASRPGWLHGLLFIAGVGQAFIVPLLGALALTLAGHRGVNKLMGRCMSWNHAGNIGAALFLMGLVTWFGLEAVFYATTFISVLAAAACLVMRPEDMERHRRKQPTSTFPWRAMLRDRRVIMLLVSTTLFHLANAPVTSLVALYIREQKGPANLIAELVLMAQLTMVFVAWLAGFLGERIGRKAIMAIGFCVLPVRICLYALVPTSWFLPVQVLDGLGAGIYGVLVPTMCADIDNGRRRFSTLMGLAATAFALGNVIGPAASGFLVQHLGFHGAFYSFAGAATVAAITFVVGMPDTEMGSDEQST